MNHLRYMEPLIPQHWDSATCENQFCSILEWYNWVRLIGSKVLARLGVAILQEAPA